MTIPIKPFGKDYYSTEYLAELLMLCPGTLRYWADNYNIPHKTTPGGRRRFSLAIGRKLLDMAKNVNRLKARHIKNVFGRK